MELSTIIRRQIAADARRGFSEELRTDAERLAQLNRDTVGLLGEVGEFANLLKKVDLASRISAYDGASIKTASAELREELADALIYIIRLSYALGGDIESDILNKMDKNDERYRHLEE
ncbi:MAG: MazG-like family protein [Parvularcula sp.]|jgi:NTP pyrophosphatase (non-canonical NTP hydrolase)|nr:MazG-like family protein [Parvularcula sp.]